LYEKLYLADVAKGVSHNTPKEEMVLWWVLRN